MERKNRTAQIALCGMVAALSTVVMIIAGFVPTATYALPALAGVFAMILVIELNVGWAFASFGITAVLSMLIAPDKNAALLYIFFLGYYPIVKALIERIRWRVLAYLVKLALFNAAAISAYFVALSLFALPADTFVLFGVSVPWLLLLLGNGVFIVYDFALSGLVLTYVRRLHPAFSKWLRK